MRSSSLLSALLFVLSLHSSFAQQLLNVTVGIQYTASQSAGVPALLLQTAAHAIVFPNNGTLGNSTDEYNYQYGYNFNYGSMSFAQLNLSFPFVFFGEPYSSVYIGSNGNLHFGLLSASDAYEWLPVSTNDEASFLPVFEPFNAQYNAATGRMSWSLETVAPGQRAIVIRYSNIAYTDDAYYGYSNGVSMDVLLYETPVGQIDVRYYRVDADPTGSTQFQIGMQSNEGLLDTEGEGNGAQLQEGNNGRYGGWGYFSNYFILYDVAPVDASVQAALSNTTLRFNYTGLVDSNRTCGGLGYDLSSLSKSDLTYWIPSQQQVYVVHVCGAVQQPHCAQQTVLGSPPSVCQSTADGNGYAVNGTYALAIWNVNAVLYSYLPNGVRATIQDGQQCGYFSQPRATILNFLCDPSASTANITGYNEKPQCTYNFNISTSAACGGGARNNSQGIAASTLPSCQTVMGVGYTASWCPRNISGSAANAQPQTLTNLTLDSAFTEGYYSAYDTVSIGFPVSVYGVNYSVLALTSNGLLTFGPSPVSPYTYYPAPFPDLGLGSTASDYFPLIAALWVDTTDYASSYLANANGFIGYSLEGAAPSRQFFVRFSGVEYIESLYSVVPSSASYDVVFSENSTDIEVRYYYVAPNPSSLYQLVVGMHGLNGSTYTAVQNAPVLSVDIAARLSYSTIVYSYTGPSEAAVCGAGVFPQLASIPDLVYSSGSTRYWLKPCGVTTTSSCVSGSLATQAASVCQVQGSTVSSLATDNPTATQWSITANTSAGYSVQSVTQDGSSSASCGATPTVVVNYTCSSTAVAAVLNSVAVSGCTYTFSVSTSMLCTAAAAPPSTSSPPSSSSAGSSASPSSSSAASFSSSPAPSTSTSPSSTSAPSQQSSSPSSSSAAPSSTTTPAPTTQPTSAPAPSSSPTSTVASSTSAPAPYISSSAFISSSTSITSIPVPSPSSSSAISPTPSTASASSSSTAAAAAAGGVSNSSGGGSGLSGGAIAGIVIGTLAGVALLCVLLFLLVARNGKSGSKRFTDDSSHGSESERGEGETDDDTREVELQHVSTDD